MKTQEENDEKMTAESSKFLGCRLPQETYRRLYRAKARLELSTGRFYGLGKLLARVIEEGLKVIESEIGGVDAPEEDEDAH